MRILKLLSSYSAMFYLAEALLFSKGLAFSSHSPVIAAFGREFAKTNLLNPKFHNYLIRSQDRRNIGDYAIGSHLTEGEVLEMLSWAKEFLKAGKNYLAQVR